MSRANFASCCVLVALGLLSLGRTPAEAAEPVWLGETLGDEVDREERDRYGLFPGIDDFVSARIVKDGDKYRLEYVTGEGRRRRTRSLSADAVELTLLHLANVDEYDRAAGAARRPASAC